MDRTDLLGSVVQVVGAHFGVTADELISHRRTARLHRSRCIAVYLADRISGSTRPEIGVVFGRDPAVIAMYCRAIERDLSESPGQGRLLMELEQAVKLRWRMP